MDRVIEISKSDVPFVFLFLEKDFEMITAFVQFKLPQPLSRDKARDAFSGTAPTYRKIQGLIRKYYVLSEDGTTAGGVNLWHSRRDSDRLYTDDWKQFIFITIVRSVIPGEEQQLETIYGNQYLRYAKQVKRLLPIVY